MHLRSGDDTRAEAVYTSALKKKRNNPDALFGRGVATLRSGNPVAGNADLAAARALEPGIDDRFARYGVRP